MGNRFVKGHITHYDANAVASGAFGSFLLWQRVRSLLPSCYLSFTPAELYAADTLSRKTANAKSTLRISPISALVPAASALTWPEVFTLRKDKRVAAFRKWLQANSARLEKTGASDTDAIMALWEAYLDVRPSLGSEILTGVLGSIPVPGNPIGPATAIRSITRTHKHEERFGYLMFLHRMNHATIERVEQAKSIRPRDLFVTTASE